MLEITRTAAGRRRHRGTRTRALVGVAIVLAGLVQTTARVSSATGQWEPPPPPPIVDLTPQFSSVQPLPVSAGKAVRALPALSSALLPPATDAASAALRRGAIPPPPPTSISAVANGYDALVRWSPSPSVGAPVVRYRVVAWNAATSTPEIGLWATGDHALVEGLEADNTYVFTVAAATATAIGTPLASPLTLASSAPQPTLMPAAPTGIATSLTFGAATVSWTPPNAPAIPLRGFVVAAHDVNGTVIATTTVCARCTTATLQIPHGTSTFTVRSQSVLGTLSSEATSGPTLLRYRVAASASPAGLPVAGGGVPGAPTSASANPRNASIAAAWTAPSSDGGSPITQYTVNLYSSAGSLLSQQTVCASCFSLTLSGLTNGAQYSIGVFATNANGNGSSATSPTVTVGQTAAVPAAPATVTATPANASINVTWTASPTDGGSPITQYKIKTYTPDNVLVGAAITVCGTCFSTTVTGLTNGTSYYVRAYAVNAVGTSASIHSATVTLSSSGPPGAPGSVTATGSTGSVSVTWSAPTSNGGSAVTGYTATAFNPDGSQAASPVTVCGSCLTTSISGLTNGNSYYVSVYATNAIGNGPSTNSATITVGGGNGAPTVQTTIQGSRSTLARGEVATINLTVSNLANTSITVSSATAVVPTGLTLRPLSEVTMDGAVCPTSICALSGSTVTASTFTVPALGSHNVAIPAVVMGSDRGCTQGTTVGTATNAAGSSSSNLGLTLCDGNIGAQPWWTLVGTAAGPRSTVSVNAASGNAIVDATDSTPIPGHGRVSLTLQRTYNSQATGYGWSTGPIGNGWVASFDAIAGGVTAASLHVPAGESVAAAQPVTLVDAAGALDVVQWNGLASPVNVTGLSASAGPVATLIPRVLQLASPQYDHICVDQTGVAPAGVHVGIWRYIELTASSGSTPCVAAAGTTPVVLGFGVERPDRVRYEFSWDGHKLDTADANSNELVYHYASAPVAGSAIGTLTSVVETGSGRTISLSYLTSETDIQDAASRTTKFKFDVSGNLATVVNPDGSSVGYTYSSTSVPCAGAAVGQLCSITDPRGNATSMTYATTYSDGSLVIGLPKVASITDRLGKTTRFTWIRTTDTLQVDLTNERRQYSGFDASGSVGEADAIDIAALTGNPTHAMVRQTLYQWDTAGISCRQPDAVVDHNLCRVFTETLDGLATASDISFVHDPFGTTLVSRLCLHQADAVPMPALCPSTTGSPAVDNVLVTTYGVHSQIVEAGGSVRFYDDTVAGGGTVTSPAGSGPGGARADAQTLFGLDDPTQMLPPRGNGLGATVPAFLTTYRVDDNAGVSPNAPGTASTCQNPISPATNTGDLCETDAPAFDGVHATATRVSYDSRGQRLTVTSPKAIAETTSGTPPSTVYTYYQDADRDLSGTTSAGGWLKAVTDPLGNAVVTAYDAAGNVARTWDRDASHGIALSAFPGTLAAPPSPAYTEVLRAAGTGAYSAPWRYVVSSRDQLAELTTYTIDPNGNQLIIRPPRGNPISGAVTTFDITQTFDARDSLLTRQMPVERAAGAASRYTWDDYGNKAASTDPRGSVTTYQYDAGNRLIQTLWTKGAFPGDPTVVPPACRQSATGDAPIPPGRLLCASGSAYNGIDEVTASRDGNGHVTTSSYDAAGRVTVQVVPHNDGALTTLTTGRVYDLGGNVVAVCPPRAYAEGGITTCTSGRAYGKDSVYDPLGRLTSTTTYRGVTQTDPGMVTNPTTYVHDADGNVVATTDGNAHTTAAVYNLDDRRISVTIPRSSTLTETTTTVYDPTGNVTALVEPGNHITATSYDPANRVLDTVVGADSQVAALAGLPGSTGGTNIRTRSQYDADGHVVATFGPRAFTGSVATPDVTFMVAMAYDADGRVISKRTPRYDNRASGGTGLTDVGGSGTQGSQCPTNTAGITDGYPSGVGVCIWQYFYDANGNRVSEALPTSPNTAPVTRHVDYAYSDDNLVAATTIPNPAQAGTTVVAQTNYYDGDGKVIKTIDALGRPTITTYYDDELVKQVTPEPNGTVTHVTTYRYNANGNRTAATDPLAQTTTTAYFTDGLVSSVADAAGDTTTYAYDPVGNPTSVGTPAANAGDPSNTAHTPLRNTYTFDNLLLSSTRPFAPDGSKLYRTTYGYADFGGKTSQDTALVTAAGGVLADAGAEQVSYYADKRVAGEVGRDGAPTSVTYDPAGDPVTVQNLGGPRTNASTAIAANYYLDGLLRQTQDHFGGGNGTYLGYDGLGNVSARAQFVTGGRGGQIGYWTTYSYSDAEQPTAETNGYLGAWSWTYDAAGQLSTQNQPNGDYVDFTPRNPDGTTNVVHLWRGGSYSGVWYYQYDANYRKSYLEAHPVDPQSYGHSFYVNYSYNKANRLSSSTWTTDGTAYSATATWDHDGNRLTWNGATYTYNADDSLASVAPPAPLPARTYQYDGAGNTTNDTCAGYIFDGFDRVTSEINSGVAGCGIAGTTSYTYDALDNQVTHTDPPYGLTTQVHYDGLSHNVTAEQRVWNQNRNLIYALGASGGPIADMWDPSGQAAPEYLAPDGQGNVAMITGAAGQVTCEAFYGAFGDPLTITPNNRGAGACWAGVSDGSMAYRSSRLDATTQNYALGTRTYAPAVGSFMQADRFRGPMTHAELGTYLSPSLMNVYGYTNGDPVNLSDPSGHDPHWQDEPGYQAQHPQPPPGTYDAAYNPNAGCAACVNAQIKSGWHGMITGMPARVGRTTELGSASGSRPPARVGAGDAEPHPQRTNRPTPLAISAPC